MRSIQKIIILSISLLIISPMVLAQDGEVHLQISVVNEDSGKPVDGIRINLTSKENASVISGVLDIDGTFNIDIPPGEYWIDILYRGRRIEPARLIFTPPSSVEEGWHINIDKVKRLDLEIQIDSEVFDPGSDAQWWDPNYRPDMYSEFLPGGEEEVHIPFWKEHLLKIVIISALVLSLSIWNYSRIRRERLLDHSTRQNIFDYIKDNPGIHLRGIKTDLDLSMGVLNHHLNKLQEEEMIRVRSQGQYKRYYPAGARISDQPHLSPSKKQVYQAITNSPGMNPNEVANAVGQPPKNVYYHIQSLERNGLIKTRRVDNVKLCFPADT